jgi:hypothetical protein
MTRQLRTLICGVSYAFYLNKHVGNHRARHNRRAGRVIFRKVALIYLVHLGKMIGVAQEDNH